MRHARPTTTRQVLEQMRPIAERLAFIAFILLVIAAMAISGAIETGGTP